MDDKAQTLAKLLLQQTSTKEAISPSIATTKNQRKSSSAERPQMVAAKTPMATVNLLNKERRQPRANASITPQPPALKNASKPKEDIAACKTANQIKSQEAWQAKKQLLKALTVKLITNHPTLFSHLAPKPFAIGIHREIFARYPEYPRKVINLMLASWVKKRKYQEALVVGADRYNLAGLPTGKVAEHEIHPTRSPAFMDKKRNNTAPLQRSD